MSSRFILCLFLFFRFFKQVGAQHTVHDDDARQPDVTRIIDWISLILDAHHHELLIAGNDEHVKDLITNLEQLVSQSVS